MQPADCRHVAKGPGAARHLTMDQFALVRRGRSRELWGAVAAAVVLLVAQAPARGHRRGLAVGVQLRGRGAGPARAVLDTMLVAAYLLVSLRAYGRVRSLRAARDMVVLSRVGMGLVVTRRGHRPGGPHRRPLHPGMVRRRGPARPRRAAAAGATLRSWYDARTKLQPTQPSPAPATTVDLVISCSGGGTRSSAFSLGGLRALADAGVHPDASAVEGVSAGYVAAACRLRGHRPEPTQVGRDRVGGVLRDRGDVDPRRGRSRVGRPVGSPAEVPQQLPGELLARLFAQLFAQLFAVLSAELSADDETA